VDARSTRGAIVTPEAVPLDLETATVGSRAVAYLLDLTIMAVGYVALGFATTALGGGGFVPGWAGIALLLLLVFALQFGYPVGFEVLWRGRTPGKAAMGLRVVTDEGAPVGLRHAAVRVTVGLFELLATLGVPAIISSLVSSRGQRLGDLAAGTIVVRERRASATTQAETFAAPMGHEALVERMDVSGLGPRDYATVRDTVRRLPSLPTRDGTRTRIAEQVADALAPRVTPAPSGIDAETWLRCVAAALQRRRTSLPVGGTAAPPPPPAAPAAPVSPPSAPGAPPAAGPSPAPDRPASPGPERTDPPGPTGGGFVPPA
jgi:uncharacterized RDD family membrane protein YckC